MQRFSATFWLVTAAWLASSTGCTMCRTDYLCDYPAVGGKWQRSNPSCGRVGSNLSDAGAYQAGTSVEFGANYGNEWNLVEPPLLPEEGSGVSNIIDGELFESGSPTVSPEPGTIMIGP